MPEGLHRPILRDLPFGRSFARPLDQGQAHARFSRLVHEVLG
jgi:hypothetical protein